MENTYSQVHIHIVFSVKGRQNLIIENKREEVQKYIAGILQKRNHKLLAIYVMPDHVHILIGLNPSQSISDLVKEVKMASTRYINENNWVLGKFRWQEGYGAFSYSRSLVKHILKYILNQAANHKVRTFLEEYIDILKEFDINYNDKYLFDWYD